MGARADHLGEKRPEADQPVVVDALVESIERAYRDAPCLNDLWVKGEVVSFKVFNGGHAYFELRGDEEARISCVMYRRNAARHLHHPNLGQSVLRHARIDFYSGSGRTLVVADEMRLAGQSMAA